MYIYINAKNKTESNVTKLKIKVYCNLHIILYKFVF